MSDVVGNIPLEAPAAENSGASLFAVAAVGTAVAAAFLAGWAPIGFSIVTVFVFAGPHNWLEFRYFLSQMPAHWGPLRAYFLTAIGGTIALAGGFAALPHVADRFEWTDEQFNLGLSGWNTSLILWIALLAHMRSRQSPQRDWSWVWPAAFALTAVVWLAPIGFDLALVYLHPLLALWFLDREIGRSKPEWRSAYRACLACVPVLLAALWLRLWNAPDLPGGDALSLRIAQHAGAGILQGVSTHLLTATHTFLEMLHYGVWVAAVPLIAMRMRAGGFTEVPLGRRSGVWRRAVGGFLAIGAAAVVLLWAAFLADYPTTRDVYFTVAMLHVLAEAPFLLRLM
jgi:hypothetical protein